MANPETVGRFLTLRQVCELTSFGKTSIYKFQKRGLFPQSIKIGPTADRSRTVWLESEVLEWQRQQVEAARSDLAASEKRWQPENK